MTVARKGGDGHCLVGRRHGSHGLEGVLGPGSGAQPVVRRQSLLEGGGGVGRLIQCRVDQAEVVADTAEEADGAGYDDARGGMGPEVAFDIAQQVGLTELGGSHGQVGEHPQPPIAGDPAPLHCLQVDTAHQPAGSLDVASFDQRQRLAGDRHLFVRRADAMQVSTSGRPVEGLDGGVEPLPGDFGSAPAALGTQLVRRLCTGDTPRNFSVI